MWAAYATEFTSIYLGKKFATLVVWWERSEELLRQEIELAIQEDRLDDANTFIEMNKEFGYPHSSQWDQEIARRSTFFYKAKMAPAHAARGLAYGEMDSPVSTTVTIASDFFVIGDVRDLAHEGYRVSKGEELNKLVAGLAAIGLVTTFSTPVVDGGVSLAKAVAKQASKKTAKKSSGFSRLLTSKVSEAVDFDLLTSQLIKAEFTPVGIRRLSAGIGDSLHFERVTGFFYDLGVIQSKSGGTRNAMFLIKRVDSDDSLQAVKRASIGFGDKTVLMVRVGGEKVVKVFSRLFQKLVWLVGALITTAIVMVQFIFMGISLVRNLRLRGSESPA
ncbi:hypothetical protein GCM10022414_36670 [Zhongshania borealis]|uniref:Pre-toxin TG domain-containing protein n=2 Tax=Zhongshania borealis TaxID=889488 RepID=A0ABP7X761_9GAMM